MSEGFSFENLNVYQKALNFANIIYSVTDKFPKEERFVLIDQFRRAAISISLNIAEGHGASDPELRRYLRIARGSVRECVALIAISELKRYINYAEGKKLRDSCVEISKMLAGLIATLSS